MGMVSMKVQDDDQYEMAQPNPYGYGLMICLNEEQVEALGLDKNPPRPGSTVSVRAIAVVKRVTQESDPTEEVAEGEDPNDPDVTLQIQITDMEVIPQGSSVNGSLLYSGGGNG